MRRALIGGALGLLSINLLLFLLTYKGEKETFEFHPEKGGRRVNSILLEKDGTVINLKFSPADLLSGSSKLKNVSLKVKFEEGELRGTSKRGALVGNRVILEDFEGKICGGEIKSGELLLNLSSLKEITLRKFLITGSKRRVRGISTLKLNLNKLCQFLKGKRRLPK